VYPITRDYGKVDASEIYSILNLGDIAINPTDSAWTVFAPGNASWVIMPGDVWEMKSKQYALSDLLKIGNILETSIYGSRILFPKSGVESKFYIAGDTNEIYRWVTRKDAPKYIFMFIGDGMSSNQLDYVAEQGHDLCFASFPSQGTTTTSPLNAEITDSSAAATAMATGSKTNNYTLGRLPNGTNLKSIAYDLKESFYKIGIATNVSIDHATPAGFYAHSNDRNNYNEIGMQLADTNFDFFAGAGFLDPGDAYEKAQRAGYDIFETPDEWASMPHSGKVLLVEAGVDDLLLYDGDIVKTSLVSSSNRPPNYSGWTLTGFTKAGIEHLDNPNGFFFMVEGAQIDWEAHANNLEGIENEILDFNDAVQEALNFYYDHPDDTLIIVCSDHDCGGLMFDSQDGWHFTSRDHTAIPTPVFAIGEGATNYIGNYDNTDLSRKIYLGDSLYGIYLGISQAGERGPQGMPGKNAPNFAIGTVQGGEQASVTMTSEGSGNLLNFVLPKGDDAALPNFSIGTVDSGNPDVRISGTYPDLSLNFTLQPGNDGNDGLPGIDGLTPSVSIGSVSTGSTSSASMRGATPNLILDLVLQKGDKGDKGDAGPQGVAGESIVIAGRVNSYAGLPASARNGDGYLVLDDGLLYVYANGWPSDGDGVPFKGDKGDAGRSVTGIEVHYAVNNSSTSIPISSEWNSAIQAQTLTNPYLWTRTTVNFSSGSPQYSYQVTRRGDAADVSADYQIGTSRTSAPNGSWQSSMPSLTVNATDGTANYLWARISMNNGGTISYSYHNTGYAMVKSTLANAATHSSNHPTAIVYVPV